MKLITYLFGKGYTGGPDFNRLKSFHFDLEGSELELTLPESSSTLPQGEININFPYLSDGWFDHNSEQQANHFYIMVFGDLWPYVGPPWKALDRIFGILDIQVGIKRSLPDKTLNNFDSLADAICWDYEWYFEEAEPGKYGRGHNRKKREELEKLNYTQNGAGSKISRQSQDQILKDTLFEIPTKFEIRSFSDQQWLYYEMKKEANYPAHYYCQPLDDYYYLYVRFNYRIDIRNYFHIWRSNAESAEQRITEMVKLTNFNSTD